MQSRLSRWLIVSLLVLIITVLPVVLADDGNYYNFDYEDFWKEYTEWGYPVGTRLPCNGGGSEVNCTWAWKPWYEHGTDIPRFWPEQYTGRTVSGYALMMFWYGSGKRLHGGVFRRENVIPGHVYCFTMWARSGLDPQHPATTNARMRVGISATGDYPDQIVLTLDRINAINWSSESNSQYAYTRQGVVAQARGDTLTVFTRAQVDANNEPYIFWDEGSFTEIPILDGTHPFPEDSNVIQNVIVITSTGQARISWNTGSINTLGQVLYRRVGSTEPVTNTVSPTMTYHIYLPLIQKTGMWQQSAVDAAWQTTHTITLTGLEPQSIYEYVIVSYGYISDACLSVVSGSSTPRRFNTP